MLVIDDDDGVRRLLRTVFSVKDLAVMEAESGADAERRVAERRPDAIIIDLKSAETHGLDLVRRLRQRRELEAVPMVLVTVSPTEIAEAKALEAGADAVVTKPFGVAALQHRVLRLLQEGRPSAQGEPGEPHRRAG